MLRIWDVEDLGCWGGGDDRDVRCSGRGLFGMWDVWDVECLGCGMFGILDVWIVGCSGCGMFDGMWDFYLQNASLQFRKNYFKNQFLNIASYLA